MKRRDLCDKKKFPDLEDDFFITYDKKNRMTFIDEKNNIWIEGNKVGEGGHGKIVEFTSHNKDYTNLVAKFFNSFDDEEFYLDMQEETDMVNFFNLYRCKNFLRAGVKEFSRNEKIVIMEKIDGDIYNFNFSECAEPINIYEKIVNFIISGFRCALKKDKYYMDIKEENIGYKFCGKDPVFTFLDFGSFFDKDSDNILATYNINKEAFSNEKFSNEMVLVYGTIITLLAIRLSVFSKNYHRKFRDFIFDISDEKEYPDTNLLDLDYYHRIEELYFNYFKKDEEFIDILFKCLYDLTTEEPNITNFLDKISYYL